MKPKRLLLLSLTLLISFVSIGLSAKSLAEKYTASDSVLAANSVLLPARDMNRGFIDFAQAAQGKVSGLMQSQGGLILFVVLFFLLLAVPLIPAWLEVFFPKDNQPLFIDLTYIRDPRFFDKQFLGELQPYLNELKKLRNNELKFRGKTPIEYFNFLDKKDTKTVSSLLVINGNLTSTGRCSFQQPIYIKGKAEIGEQTELNILIVHGDVSIGKNSVIKGWLSSYGEIRVGGGVALTNRVVGDKSLSLAKGCTFNSLYAMPIATYEAEFVSRKPATVSVVAQPAKTDSMHRVSDFHWYGTQKFVTVPPFSTINNSLIVKSDLILHRGTVINGSVKCYGNLILERDVTVNGEVISEKDIEIGENCIVSENVFSQANIRIQGGSRIGAPGLYKSAIGKKGVWLGKNVIIYGYVMTAGKGTVV